MQKGPSEQTTAVMPHLVKKGPFATDNLSTLIIIV